MQSGLEILKTVVDAHGIRFRVLRDSADGASIEGIEDVDEGLRGQLYQNYNYSFMEHQIREDCREGCLYIGEDAFGLRYLLFRMSDTEAGTPLYITVGPYMQEGSEPETEIKVYSNQPSVTLYVDGKEYQTLDADKVFRFAVPISGEHVIEAKAGELCDRMTIRKVDQPNGAYRKPGSEIVNWFDRDDEIIREGYFSIKDSMGDVKGNAQAFAVFGELVAPIEAKAVAAYGDVAKNMKIPEEMQRMMDRMSVENSLKQMAGLVTLEFVHKLNAALNQVPKD